MSTFFHKGKAISADLPAHRAEEIFMIMDNYGDGDETIIPSLDNPLYTVAQVAKMFGVDQPTVRLWIRQEKLNAVKVMGRWRVQKSEVVRVANEEYGE